MCQTVCINTNESEPGLIRWERGRFQEHTLSHTVYFLLHLLLNAHLEDPGTDHVPDSLRRKLGMTVCTLLGIVSLIGWLSLHTRVLACLTWQKFWLLVSSCTYAFR